MKPHRIHHPAPTLGKRRRPQSETIDMSGYQSPVLTERQIQRLHDLTGRVIVPSGTVVTPKAKELLKRKQISLIIEQN
ncbi:MAG: hypothetical protein U5R06_15165 [candidate division KSB1 bacterium]|nr:hypothetical protein [candidate division KSB1 bacterium]